jgi:uncharacterized glyoxalase superfamily protein PhnB
MSAETSKTAGTATGQTEAMSEQAPAPTVWGTFQARDARAMIRFLVDLGFEETVVYGEGEVVDHAQLDWPEGGGLMCGSHRPGGEWVLEPGTAGFYVVTADPRSVRDRAEAAGAQIVRELNSTDYGSTEFGLRDPEGNQWSFGTYRGEPRATD